MKSPLYLLCSGALVVAILVAAGTVGMFEAVGDERASASGATPDIFTQVSSIPGCTTNTPGGPPDSPGEVVCSVPLYGTFVLEGHVASIAGIIDTDSDPGYAGFQFRFLHTPGLTLINPAGTESELGSPVRFWPGCTGERSDDEASGQYDISCENLEGDESTYLGKLVEVTYQCSTPGQNTLTMNDAASYVYDESHTNVPLDKQGPEVLTISCGQDPAPTPTPSPSPTPKNPIADTDGDTVTNDSDDDDDNDGCSDAQETTSDEEQGGSRNPHNFWDFYDVWSGTMPNLVRNGAVSASDFFSVLGRFGASGSATSVPDALTEPVSASGYHAAFDRGPQTGPHSWDRAPANGAIASPDFFAVIAQFGHSCA